MTTPALPRGLRKIGHARNSPLFNRRP